MFRTERGIFSMPDDTIIERTGHLRSTPDRPAGSPRPASDERGDPELTF
jgi:hypothetical protein